MDVTRAAPARARILAAAVGVAVVALAALSVPRLFASLVTFAGTSELRALRELKPVPDADLQAIISAHEMRLGWVSSPKFAAELGLAALMLYDRTGDSALLAKGERALVRSLEGDPASPYAWARLAYARERQNAPPEAVIAAVVMSVLTGPHEPRLVPSRLYFGLRYWPSLTPDQQDLVRRQIRYGMQVAPKDVVASADSTWARAIIRAALAAEPYNLAQFETALRRARR